jgi:hypothetical protein
LRVAGLLFGICAAFEEAIEQMNDVQAIFTKKAMLRDWKEGISMAHGIWMQPWHMAGHAMALSCTNYSL